MQRDKTLETIMPPLSCLHFCATGFCRVAIKPEYLPKHGKLKYKIEGFLGSKYNKFYR